MPIVMLASIVLCILALAVRNTYYVYSIWFGKTKPKALMTLLLAIHAGLLGLKLIFISFGLFVAMVFAGIIVTLRHTHKLDSLKSNIKYTTYEPDDQQSTTPQ